MFYQKKHKMKFMIKSNIKITVILYILYKKSTEFVYQQYFYLKI